jgi:hypothetical protein
MILNTQRRWSLSLTAVFFILLYCSLSLLHQVLLISEISKQIFFNQRSPEVQYPSSQKIYDDIETLKDVYNKVNDDINKNSIKTNEESGTSKYHNLLNLVLNIYLITFPPI